MALETSIPTRTVVLGCVRRDSSLDAAEVYAVAEACGMTDLQVRLCLRRLVAEGALKQVRGRGRQAEFVARGKSANGILPELEYVEFAYRQDAGLEPWDGRWRLLGFSVAESRRAMRDELRDLVRYFGGAPVQGGLYASPHAWDHLLSQTQDLGIADTLTLIECDTLSVGGVTEPRQLAERLWPLDAVALGYEDFMGRLEDRLEPAPESPEVVLAAVIATAVDFAHAIEPDPLLPLELLPDRWPGTQARRCLIEAQRRLPGLEPGDRYPGFLGRLITAADRSSGTSENDCPQGAPARVVGGLSRHPRGDVANHEVERRNREAE